MGSEDEAEQSLGRPHRSGDGGSSGHANSPHPSSWANLPRSFPELRRECCSYALHGGAVWVQKPAHVQREIAIRLTTQSSSQIQTIFGTGYVSEQRSDETRRYLPPLDRANPFWISAELSTSESRSVAWIARPRDRQG